MVHPTKAVQREQERGISNRKERSRLDPIQERTGTAILSSSTLMAPILKPLSQSWTFKIIPKTATINALVSIFLDPSTVDSNFIQVKYHKDQANDKDYSHEGLVFTFKKCQADQVAKNMDSKEVEQFAADKGAGKEHVRKYGCGGKDGDAPVKDFVVTNLSRIEAGVEPTCTFRSKI